jgi:phospholipid transport system substrate-binding protein
MAQTDQAKYRSTSRPRGVSRLLGTVAFALLTLPVSAALGDDHAAVFVKKVASEAISVLTDPSLATPVRRGQFRSIILTHFDASAIARFVVGPYWSKSTPEQQQRFEQTFEGALASIYTERFYDYDGESLQIKGTRPGSPGVAVVQTTIDTPTGTKSYDVEWMVAGEPGHERLIDVVIDGVSTSKTTQQDYASVLRVSNGDLDALTSALKSKGN